MTNTSNILPISVVMSVFREPENYLRDSIESILNQNFKNFEFLIAIDDPNNEKAIEVISEYAKADNRIKFFVNKKNLGQAISRNNLINKAIGNYIAIMDGDDISLPSRLEEQFEFMENNIHVGILGTLAYKIDEKGEIYGIMNAPTNEKCIEAYIKSGLMPVVHPSIMVRKEIYLSLGLYKPVVVEDYEFILRAFLSNIKIFNLEKVLLKYRVHSHSYKITQTKRWLQYHTVKYILQGKTLSFNQHDYENFIKIKSKQTLFLKLFNFASRHFILAMDYKSKRKWISFAFHFLLSFISPHQVEEIFRIIRIKLICKVSKFLQKIKL